MPEEARKIIRPRLLPFGCRERCATLCRRIGRILRHQQNRALRGRAPALSHSKRCNTQHATASQYPKGLRKFNMFEEYASLSSELNITFENSWCNPQMTQNVTASEGMILALCTNQPVNVQDRAPGDGSNYPARKMKNLMANSS